MATSPGSQLDQSAPEQSNTTPNHRKVQILIKEASQLCQNVLQKAGYSTEQA